MNEWVQLLSGSHEPQYAIAQCEYCGRFARYDQTMEFYCRGCGAPLPFTSLFKNQEQERSTPEGDWYSVYRPNKSPYFADGGTSIQWTRKSPIYMEIPRKKSNLTKR